MFHGLLIVVIAALVILGGCADVATTDEKTRGIAAVRRDDAPAGAVPITGVSWSTIGQSVRSRPIVASSIGDGPRRVLIIGGIHGDEREGLSAVDDLVRHLASRHGDGKSEYCIRIIRDVNPDGSAAGTRTNARGVDLNRNWNSSNFRASRGRGSSGMSEPETRAVRTDMDEFRPDAVIVLHSSHSGPFVNYDGPAKELAAAFATAAARSDRRWHPVAEMGYATPGSLGSLVGDDAGVPILTIEFDRGQESLDVRAALLAGVDAVLSALRNQGAGSRL